MKRRAVLYLRYSDKKQDGGTSIPVQRKSCTEYCQSNSWKIVDELVYEAVSADHNKEGKTNRVATLLNYCRKNKGKFDVLVVYNISRLARSVEHQQIIRNSLLEKQIILRSATEKIDETPAGRFIEVVLAGQAEFNNSVKKIASRDAMYERVDEGLWPWQGPLGYYSTRKKDEKLKPHAIYKPLESTIRQVFEEYSTGTVEQTQIAKRLAKRKLINFNGKTIKFSKQTVEGMLKNIYYTGYLLNKQSGEIVKGKHKAIISLELWKKCQNVKNGRSNNRDKPRRVHFNSDFPLLKFVTCEHCGVPLRAYKAKQQYPLYECRTKDCPLSSYLKETRGKQSISGADFNNEFAEYLSNVKPHEKLVNKFIDVFIEEYEALSGEIQGDYLKQLDKIKELEQDKKFVMKQGKKGNITEEDFKEEMAEINQNLLMAKSELTELYKEELDVDTMLTEAKDFLRTVENAWYNANPYYKTQLQRFIFPDGVIYGKNGFTNSKINPLFSIISDIASEQSMIVTPYYLTANKIQDFIQAVKDMFALIENNQSFSV